MSEVIGPEPAIIRALPMELSEELLETDPLRADGGLGVLPQPVPGAPLAMHCECLHAARLAWRADLSGNTDLSVLTRADKTRIIPSKTSSPMIFPNLIDYFADLF